MGSNSEEEGEGERKGDGRLTARARAQSNPGMRVLVAGTENILDNLYWGNQRSMLITCCIFRLGGVAALLSNRRRDARRAKYRLQHLVRTHLGASDQAYKCGPRPPRAPLLASEGLSRAPPRLGTRVSADPRAHAPDAPAGACSAVHKTRCFRRWSGAARHSYYERGCSTATCAYCSGSRRNAVQAPAALRRPGARRSCVMQKDDEVGKLGMRIGRDLMSTAGRSLRINITTLGPLVLPLSEKLIYAGNLVARKARAPAPTRRLAAAWPVRLSAWHVRLSAGPVRLSARCLVVAARAAGVGQGEAHLEADPAASALHACRAGGLVALFSRAGRLTGAAGDRQALGLRSQKPYVPDFSTAFQHFCIHPGGKAVIEEARCPARPRASLRCQAPPPRACDALGIWCWRLCAVCRRPDASPAMCAQTWHATRR